MVTETKTRTKKKSKEPDLSEKMIDSMLGILKKNHNWKFFAGMVVTFVILLIV
jgi:hypothetical protein